MAGATLRGGADLGECYRGKLLSITRGPRGALAAVNAVGELPLGRWLAWLDAGGRVPELERVAQVELGHAGPAPFGFTDAALGPDGRVVFLACAEDSPDAVQDGPILGCRFGVIAGDDVRMTPVLDAQGSPAGETLEGIEPTGEPAWSFHVVADMDRPEEPALLGRLEVSGAAA